VCNNNVMTYVEKQKVFMLQNNVELVLDKIDTCLLFAHGSRDPWLSS
jgi:hypothetical protein